MEARGGGGAGHKEELILYSSPFSGLNVLCPIGKAGWLPGSQLSASLEGGYRNGVWGMVRGGKLVVGGELPRN